MAESNRDEQLRALEAIVDNAERKLKSAEITVKDIENKLKTEESAFAEKISEKAEAYKTQTGADFQRVVDENGRVTYEFHRETTEEERKKRQKLAIRRRFDPQSGKSKTKIEFYNDDSDLIRNVHTAQELEKPMERKRYIAYKVPFGGYHRIDISTEVNNPFLQAVGKPIIVPIQTAARIQSHFSEKLHEFSETSVGKGLKTTGKVISAPIVLPARFVKDIADKGGVIHSVVDVGDRIKIEGFNNPISNVTNKLPTPVKSTVNTVKKTAVGTALAIETAVIETGKGVGKFSLEIAKDKIYEEINKGVSENEATQAAYVLGVKFIDVYKILHEHAKYRRAVARDKAGDDIQDINVSRHLAEKREKQFQKSNDKLSAQKDKAEQNLNTARSEFEIAKQRLEQYRKNKGISIDTSKISKSTPADKIKDIPKSDEVLKLEKKIERTKSNLHSARKHKYKLAKTYVYDAKNDRVRQTFTIVRVETTGTSPANLWNTKKKLEGLAISDTAKSLRQKAMRDGGDNSGVEAANFTVTAAQQGNRFIRFADEKERQLLEKKYEKELTKLENQKKLAEESTRNQPKAKETSAKQKKNTDTKSQQKAQQKKNLQKRNQKKIYNHSKAKKTLKSVLVDLKNALIGRVKSIGTFVVLMVISLIIPSFSLTMCGGMFAGTESVLEEVVSPSSTNDITQVERYYTELAKNMINLHQNIEYFYQGYNKYICKTEIDKITHSPEKLLPYIAVKTLSVNDENQWTFEQAVPYIENVFNSQYKFEADEKHEIRKNVTTTVYSVEDEYYSSLGTSEYVLGEYPSEDIPIPLKSDVYAGFANTYTHVEHVVMEGYIDNVIDNVGVHTATDGTVTEYDEAETKTFQNK